MLSSCTTSKVNVVATSERSQDCSPVYEQVYQPSLQLGGSGRMVNIRRQRDCATVGVNNAANYSEDNANSAFLHPTQLHSHFERVRAVWRDDEISVGWVNLHHDDNVDEWLGSYPVIEHSINSNVTILNRDFNFNVALAPISEGRLQNINLVFFNGHNNACSVSKCKPANEESVDASTGFLGVGSYNTNYTINHWFVRSVPPRLIVGQDRMNFPAGVIREYRNLIDTKGVDGFVLRSSNDEIIRTVCLISLSHEPDVIDYLIKDCLAWSLVPYYRALEDPDKSLGGMQLVKSLFFSDNQHNATELFNAAMMFGYYDGAQ